MRSALLLVCGVVGLGSAMGGQTATAHLNPVIDLLSAKRAIFGVSQPSNGRAGGGGNRGGGGAAAAGAATPVATPTPAPPPQKTPVELAKDALAHPEADYLFNGSMEYGVDRGLPGFTTFADAMVEAGGIATTPAPHLKAPFAVKTLNANGELLLWVIVESKPGLANLKNIAAVKGISVMFTGAGTLGGVFSTVGDDGRRVRDDAAWEAANQQILAACKDARLSCGYPANATDIETRMKQGFDAFIIQSFSDQGFKAVALGRAAAGRDK